MPPRTEARAPLGVVLLQLGGPDSQEAVEPFLFNLFADPDIIDLPLAFLFRRRLAAVIARRRAPRVAAYYARIGGRSPILKLTRRQAAALERALSRDVDARVVIAMRYWHPDTAEALESLLAAGCRRVVLLPLYPHYSKTTTGSSVREWERVLQRRGVRNLSVARVGEYCEHPLYIAAIVRNIRIALGRVPADSRRAVHLVFSAHGTPVSLVKAGDPYRGQIERTVGAVVRAGDFGLAHHLCFQSKVGPQKWLAPTLGATLASLAGSGVTHVIVVPVAFVSDHSETLWEINIEAREEARRLGIRYFDMMPALHTAPEYIAALRDLVMENLPQ
ncbi:MAG TPA: ferrochelatase [Bacteroidota bacterium]|nr:ferrochelatase [Bacteroidota bacterium]